MKNGIFTKSYIQGIAATLPKNFLSVKDMSFVSGTVENIEKISEIHEIRVAGHDKTAVDYCADAAETLLEELKVNSDEVDGLVFVTSHPDYKMPGSGYVVHERLGLSRKCIVMDLQQACSGYVNGLFQASLLVESGYCKKVLLCVGDTPTKSIHEQDKSLRTIMGDAGTATLVSLSDAPVSSAFAFINQGAGLKSLYIPAGGSRMPSEKGVTDVEKTDDQGNTRTLENMYMNGLDVMCFAMEAGPKTINEVLRVIGWHKDEVELFAFHQANKFIVESLGKRLRVPRDKIIIQMENCGNTGCASIPLALCQENSQRVISASRMLLCGFGSGLSCAAVALSMEKTVICKMRLI